MTLAPSSSKLMDKFHIVLKRVRRTLDFSDDEIWGQLSGEEALEMIEFPHRRKFGRMRTGGEPLYVATIARPASDIIPGRCFRAVCASDVPECRLSSMRIALSFSILQMVTPNRCINLHETDNLPLESVAAAENTPSSIMGNPSRLFLIWTLGLKYSLVHASKSRQP